MQSAHERACPLSLPLTIAAVRAHERRLVRLGDGDGGASASARTAAWFTHASERIAARRREWVEAASEQPVRKGLQIPEHICILH